MRKLIIAFSFIVSIVSFGQDRGEFWFAAGVKREVAKNFVAGANTNLRINYYGQIQTLYQELSLKSEHLDWFRPSVEYRLITSYDKRGNYSNSNRVNVNLDFRHKLNNLKVGARFRVQTNLGRATSGGGDLDPALRIKPYVAYDKKEWMINPELSTEFFYTTANSPTGDRFNRMRIGLTGNIDLPGPHELGLTYYYGRKFNTSKQYQEHLLSLEYTFEWKKKK